MSGLTYNFATHLFNPVYWHIIKALRNPDLRFIFIYGGSSASKTHTLVQALSVVMAQDNASTMVLRKFGVDIDDSIYSDYKGIGNDLQLDKAFIFQKHLIKFGQSKTRFRGLDDSEKLKGLSQYTYLYYNELTQFEEADLDQGRKRLRGRPGQKIIADWNPITEKHWIKANVLDKETWIDQPLSVPEAPTRYSVLDAEDSFVRLNERGNMLLIKITYKDNFWVVGHPDKPARGFYDRHTVEDFEWDRVHKPNYFRIYGKGNWGVLKTGSEFWKSFDETVNAASVKPIQGLPIHISVDSNVRPYVTISIWQIDLPNRTIYQIGEIPCKTPDNNAVKAAKKLAEWMNKYEMNEGVFVYGDPSGKAENTIDEDCKSFFDKFIGELKKYKSSVRDMVQKSAARIAMSASFINDIFEGLMPWKIIIGNHCTTSIDDYNSVQEDQNGGMEKPKTKDPITGKMYETQGHYSDAMRYLVVAILKTEYDSYKMKRKNNNLSRLGGLIR